MSAKQHVLSALEQSKGVCISGAKLADELSISRNAVWKVIKALQSEGYAITGIPNKGYCLSETSDILSVESITPYLSDNCKDLSLLVQKHVASTNTSLKALAAEGEKEGTVLIAEEQTKGRGRQGRPFYSPPETGIYMSILLRPRLTMDDAPLVTTLAATAVAEAIEFVTGCSASIKWVNDIYFSGKKIGGILTEAGVDFEGGSLEYCVVGIGVNVSNPIGGFPEELKSIAGGIFQTRVYSSNLRSRLAAEILNRLWGYYKAFHSKDFINEYRRRSFLIGREICVLTSEKPENATVLGIDEKARLVVKLASGEIRALSSGEVSIRPLSPILDE